MWRAKEEIKIANEQQCSSEMAQLELETRMDVHTIGRYVF